MFFSGERGLARFPSGSLHPPVL